jgi:NADPH:quinone reductase-like Zn-dependent oxidoreductase
VPAPDPGRIRVVVHACGLTPADWALCRGLFPGKLPRGIGIDVSGTVDALGDVRDTFHEDPTVRVPHVAFPEFAQLAADGKFTVPIAGTFPLQDWRTAMKISLSGRARGKLLLLP